MRTVDDSTQPTEAPPQAGSGDGERVLDRYRLVRRLGAGGFGVVWLAEDERLGRAVAVKRIVMQHANVAARAEREARAAARLSHPGIVALYESGRDDDAIYLVSELVRGRTLADLMDDGELSDRDVLRIGIAMCDAIAHAHRRGVIHRDVKPGNVIVPDRGPGDEPAAVAKLTDFGIARMLGDDGLTDTGDVVGTLAYMAPEQAEGGEVGAAADHYALALVLYEALSGVNPVRGRGAAATARRLGARLPPLGRLRRDLPLGLCWAIDRGVHARPEERGAIAELRAALAAGLPHAGDEPGTIGGGPLEGLTRISPPRPRPAVGPRARLGAALAAGVLAAAALQWLAPDPPLDPAIGAAAAALATLALPRLGWAALAVALIAWAHQPKGALLALAAAPTIVLLRRSGPLWSLPAGAPLLGAAGLAGAWPALAAQAEHPWHRAALGALGWWWLALAEVLVGTRLALGPPPGAQLEGSHVTALVGSGALAMAGLWAAGAVLLPVVVRGRLFAADLIGATAWAAALGTATQAIASSLDWEPQMRGLVAGAVLSGGLAVAIAAARGRANRRDAS